MRHVSAVLLLLAGTCATAQPARVDQFAWLTGCWTFDTPDGRYEEYWTAPTGNSILGMSRRVADGFTKEFEFLRVVTAGDGSFDYIAQPQGAEGKRFGMLSMVGTRVIFENLQNEFPQRIVYEYLPPNALDARVEGDHQGKPSALSFPMKRVGCP